MLGLLWVFFQNVRVAKYRLAFAVLLNGVNAGSNHVWGCFYAAIARRAGHI